MFIQSNFRGEKRNKNRREGRPETAPGIVGGRGASARYVVRNGFSRGLPLTAHTAIFLLLPNGKAGSNVCHAFRLPPPFGGEEKQPDHITGPPAAACKKQRKQGVCPRDPHLIFLSISHFFQKVYINFSPAGKKTVSFDTGAQAGLCLSKKVPGIFFDKQSPGILRYRGVLYLMNRLRDGLPGHIHQLGEGGRVVHKIGRAHV